MYEPKDDLCNFLGDLMKIMARRFKSAKKLLNQNGIKIRIG